MANTFSITLKEVREVADGTCVFVFDKPEGYEFKAGQYVALVAPKLDDIEPDQRGLSRSLSIASAPCENELWFAMRKSDSYFKRTMWALEPGAIATITKSVGFFTVPEDDDRPIVFLIGGIGITPARAILKQAEHDHVTRQFTLFYSNRFDKDAAFEDEMRAFDLPGYRFVRVLSKSDEVCAPENDERGYICEEAIKKYVPATDQVLYYIVGSPQFAGAMETLLDSMGIPKERRHMDPFSGMVAQSVR
jgi:ferredoxin-NADP reductase